MDAQDDTAKTTHSVMSLVCEGCRNGLFTLDSFRAAWNATGLYGGFSYTTTWDGIVDSAALGCAWCRVIQESRDSSTPERWCNVIVRFSERNSSSCTPEGVAHLRLTINRIPISSFFIYTEKGRSYIGICDPVHATYDM